MRLAWMTDPHLNFVKYVESFGNYCIEDHTFDAIVITGDISEAPTLFKHLAEFSAGIGNKPIYFVLGNHDFYRGSVEDVRDITKRLNNIHPNMHYLTQSNWIQLDMDTALVGDDGWYDARAGDPETSMVYLSDFEVIAELRKCLNSDIQYPPDVVFARGDRWPLINYCREQAKLSAERAKPKLLAAAARAETVIFATHFPPFEKACWHNGGISNADWLPWFTNVTMGEMLDEVAALCPDTRFEVLCGHTHSSGTFHATPNMVVYTGKAEYRSPEIYKILELPLNVP